MGYKRQYGNSFIQGLYDMASYNDDNGLSALDEAKLRKHLNSNKKALARNKDIFLAEEPKAKTCSLYDPCPICDKCRNKASHLYVRCQTCQIPICVHTYKDRDKMIRRENFRIPATPEMVEVIRNIVKEE